jgi:hypothetical protein
MSKILKNNTLSTISILDTGISVLASSQYTIPPQDYLLWAASNNIITEIGNGNLIVNDGSTDLNISDGTDLIKGISSKKIIGNTDGTAIGNIGDRLKTETTIISTAQDPSYVTFNPASFDAFSRFRVSNPTSIFDCSFFIDKQPLIFSELLVSSATVAHDSNKKSVVLTSSNTLNSKATFQSKQYMKYHPGKSQLILLTGSLNGAVSNNRKRIGQFDVDNGYFFELSSSTLKVVIRSKISGSVVDTTVEQSSWNLDKLDGTGTSGHTIDVSKQQIFIIDYQWLGSGKIRYGFFVNNKILYCHEAYHANNLSVPYSQTADLPIRVECETLATNATSSMWLTCCSVMSEGDWGPTGVLRTASRTTGFNFSSGNSTRPIISLRKQSAYVNIPVSIIDSGIFASSVDDFIVKIIINPTLTGASWSNLSGVCQIDTSATAISGGTEVYSYYLRGSTTGASTLMPDIFKDSLNLVLGSDLAGNSDIITIAAYNITLTATAYGVINYKELI